MTEWRIYLKHPGGHGWRSFTGTREEAEAKAASLMGKPASWNINRRPEEPNMWDLYTSWRVEPWENEVLTDW